MNTLRFLVIGLVLLMLGVWLGRGFDRGSGNAENEHQVSRVYEIHVPLAPFTLTDHRGKEFNQWSLNRKWTFMFFGYIFCPDVCPTALVDLNDVYQNLFKMEIVLKKSLKSISR